MTDANDDRPTLPPIADYQEYVEAEVALSTHPYYPSRDLAHDYCRAVIGEDKLPANDESTLPHGCEGRPL